MIHGRTSRFLGVLGICFITIVLWRHFQAGRQALERPKESPGGERAETLGLAAPGGSALVSPKEAARGRPRLGHPGGAPVLADPEQAPGWAVQFGGEFWRRTQAEDAATPAHGAVENVPFSIGDVIDRVTHALETLEGGTANGLPGVRAATYTAWFDDEGLGFSPHRPVDDGRMEPGRAAGGADGSAAGVSSAAPDPGTEVRVRTLTVQRDDEVFYAAGRDEVEWSVAGNTAQGLLSRAWGVVAHFEAGAAGVEAAWVFPNPLPGAGPIDVSFSLEGLAYAGLTEQGHHFADATGTARVRVSEASAVDAAGTRWELAMEAATDGSGRMKVLLPAEIQAEAVFPLAIDPVIGPEFGADSPVPSPASGSQANAAVGAFSSGFLVVWEDTRNAGATGTDLYGARVSNTGVVLDPLGIAICTASGTQATPALGLSGSTFLVVWRDTRLGASEIFGARVTTSGAVLDPLGFPVSVAATSQTAPAVAGGPPGFLVAWADDRNAGANGTDIYGARVSTAGVVLDPAGIGICTNAADQLAPTVAADGSGFFVAWEDGRNNVTTGTDIYAARVSGAGVVLEPTGVTLCNAVRNQLEAAAAVSGTNILVVWRDRRNQPTTGYDIFGTRVSTAGNIITVLDPLGIGVSTNNLTQQTPAVARSGDGFLVVWRDARNGGGDDIYGARVAPDGIVLQPAGIVINTNTLTQSAPAAAGNTSGALVVWTDPRNSASAYIGNNIYGARVTAAGVLVETNHFPVSQSGAVQAAPAVAFNGPNYLVVWQDERWFTTNGSDILGARVSMAGKVIDPNGLRICALPGAQRNPAVGVSGSDFLVAWEDSRNSGTTGTDIYASRVTWAGAVADPAGVVVSTAAGEQTVPTVAGNATTFLVAWQDDRNGGSGPDIYCTRVDQAGVVANPAGVVISTIGTPEYRPKLAATSNGFLAVWEDNVDDILAVRVSSAGTVLDPSGSAIDVCSQGGAQYYPSLAAVGTNFLVAWTDDRSSGDTGSDIYAARVSGDGTVLDAGGFAVWTSPGNQVRPVVAGTSNEFVLVWEDLRSGQEFVSTRIGVDGAVLDPWGVPLAGSGDRVLPAVAADGGGKILVVSEGFRRNSRRMVAGLISGEPAAANPILQFGRAVYTVSEAGKFAKIKVGLKGKYSGVITVDLITSDGTAVAGSDYLPQVTRLVFGAGKTSMVVSIPILNDLAVEGNETLTLDLRNPVGGALLGARHTATLTILDDDD